MDDEVTAAPAIACHLRSGARALLRMTEDALGGRATSYYPDGRARQRPGTLTPAAGESARDVLDDWESTARALDRVWDGLVGAGWATPVVEPPDNPDLGTVPLARLALARANHRTFDRSLVGSWSFRGSDGFRWLVAVDGQRVVESRPPAAESEPTTAVISTSSRDLLALLLGRPPTGALHLDGDLEFARAFSRAFPGP